jgi:hypothetical protein
MFELKIFFDIDVEDRKLTVGKSIRDCDIIIRQEANSRTLGPSFSPGLIVEFDGAYWHNKEDSYEKDLRKTKTLQKAG